MSFYPLLVFLHVLGAVGMFAAWAVESVGLAQLARASTLDEVRAWMALRRRWMPIGMAAMLLAIVTGVTAMLLSTGPTAWTSGAIIELVAIVVIGIAFDRRHRPRLMRRVKAESEIVAVAAASMSASLVASLDLRVSCGIAILALMTVKPGIIGALAIMAAAAAAGIVASRQRLRGDGVRPFAAQHPES